jgi:hypothetical protein
MADNVFRVTVVYTQQGQQMNNVIHFSGPSSDPAQMNALADEVTAHWVPEIRSQQSGDVRYVAIIVRLLDSQFAPITKAISIGGGSGNDNDKTTYCHVVRIRSALIGKHGRGRVYIGGIPNNADQKSFLDTDRVTAWTNHLATIMAWCGPTGSSAFRIGITRKQNPTANFIEAVRLEIAPQYSLQRRRKVGIGV